MLTWTLSVPLPFPLVSLECPTFEFRCLFLSPNPSSLLLGFDSFGWWPSKSSWIPCKSPRISNRDLIGVWLGNPWDFPGFVSMVCLVVSQSNPWLTAPESLVASPSFARINFFGRLLLFCTIIHSPNESSCLSCYPLWVDSAGPTAASSFWWLQFTLCPPFASIFLRQDVSVWLYLL